MNLSGCFFGESKIIAGFVSRAAPKGSHNKRWLPDARASRLTTAKAPGENGRKCTEVVCLFGESKIVTGFVSRAAPKGSHNKR